MIYNCERCDYETDKIYNYKRHLNSVNPCKDILNSNKTIDEIKDSLVEEDRSHLKYPCTYCDMKFSSYQGVYLPVIFFWLFLCF